MMTLIASLVVNSAVNGVRGVFSSARGVPILPFDSSIGIEKEYRWCRGIP